MTDEQEQAAARIVQMLARSAARMDYEKATNMYVLNARERKALQKFHDYDGFWELKGKFVGVGKITLGKLLELDLIMERRDSIGWKQYRIHPDNGYRCIYGKTNDEIRSGKEPIWPLKVWSVPHSPN